MHQFRKWRRRALWSIACIVVVGLAYALLLAYPGLLFAYEARTGRIVVHARHPISSQMLRIAARAEERLSRSELYQHAPESHVYLCDKASLFSLLSAGHWHVGGVVHTGLNGNIFLRPSVAEHDRLMSPAGKEVPGPRTLTYFLAHELVHRVVAARLGRWDYHRLATWQQEGYADYIAWGAPIDFAAWLAMLRSGAREMDPEASGLYYRYHLLVAYALLYQGLSARELMASPRSQAQVEAALKGGSRRFGDNRGSDGGG